jgi:hypothetical protein
MPRVVVQLINDAGEVASESTVIADATTDEAERVMAKAVDGCGISGPPSNGLHH